MASSLPELPADLSLVQNNGGMGFARLSDWDDVLEPVVGQQVLAVGHDARLEAVISEIRDDGMVMLQFPQFAKHAAVLEDPGAESPPG